MAYEIVFAATAHADFLALDARRRSTVKRAIEVHLQHEPTKTIRSRIKRLKGLRRPQYRLGVADMRVFYDVDNAIGRVEILRIIDKQLTDTYLSGEGVIDEEDSTLKGEG